MTATPPFAEAGDCLTAIERGLRAMAVLAPDGGPFTLTAVTNLLRGVAPPAGPRTWALTFKASRLIPVAPGGVVGAGGEVTVRLDLADLAAPPRIVVED